MTDQDIVWCHGTPIRVEGGRFEEHDNPRSLVRFSGPIREEWKTVLAARGVRVEFWAPPFGACVTLPADLRPGALSEFPFLAGGIAYDQEHCARPVPSQNEAQRA